MANAAQSLWLKDLKIYIENVTRSALLLLEDELIPQALPARSNLSLFSINALNIFQPKLMAHCCS